MYNIHYLNKISAKGTALWTENYAATDALKDAGIVSSPTDWSDAKSLAIPEPRCAIVNIVGSGAWPQTKTANQQEYLEFWDCQGNYFKKPIILNAQGQSTMVHPKKPHSSPMVQKMKSVLCSGTNPRVVWVPLR